MIPLLLLAIIVGIGTVWLWPRTRHGLPLPPGPKPLPIIGNLHQMPRQSPWFQYHEWHRTYGPIISLQLGQRTFISIGSHAVARDLLTKKSNIYSSRPRFVVAGDCAFRGLNTAFLPYGPRWRTHHRIQSTFLKAKYTSHYGPIQDLESKTLLRDLLGGDNFPSLFLRYAYSINSTLAYGARVEDVNSTSMVELSTVSKMLAGASATTMGGLVEIFPVLNHLPSWLAPWKDVAAQAYNRALALYTTNLRNAQATPSWNWVKGAAGIDASQSVSDEEFANIIGFVFDAGSETVCGALEMFVLAAVSHPLAMQKAQDEIEQIVGSNRLPGINDLPNLPFTRAVARETLRWRPLVPLGFPHEVTEDDEYMGYRIPKGATILPMHWAMDLDESVFTRATEFVPERWLEDPDLPLAAFGFARRHCPGRHLAQDSLCMAIARMLWAFDIASPVLDGKASAVDTWKLQQGALCPPVHFMASFRLRGEERRSVIEAEWEKTEKHPDRFMATIESLVR